MTTAPVTTNPMTTAPAITKSAEGFSQHLYSNTKLHHHLYNSPPQHILQKQHNTKQHNTKTVSTHLNPNHPNQFAKYR